ncbi:hypothetical protein E5Q_00127 [Mixia osmundae IAM 14324]|uniref:SUZ domain-containing protein n=1 Tax=Mixia osmundae (strain CBS 9802 / IAM 14324 / JCM 22182 / KY 12970) TaxID=764103 RepID=G7DSC6_MIXOS|nr:hypothetical protein E5Q_00127 [Mixia osmundae IAM 14324]
MSAALARSSVKIQRDPFDDWETEEDLAQQANEVQASNRPAMGSTHLDAAEVTDQANAQLWNAPQFEILSASTQARAAPAQQATQIKLASRHTRSAAQATPLSATPSINAGMLAANQPRGMQILRRPTAQRQQELLQEAQERQRRAEATGKSLEEREKEYQKAKERIFGASSAKLSLPEDAAPGQLSRPKSKEPQKRSPRASPGRSGSPVVAAVEPSSAKATLYDGASEPSGYVSKMNPSRDGAPAQLIARATRSPRPPADSSIGFASLSLQQDDLPPPVAAPQGEVFVKVKSQRDTMEEMSVDECPWPLPGSTSLHEPTMTKESPLDRLAYLDRCSAYGGYDSSVPSETASLLADHSTSPSDSSVFAQPSDSSNVSFLLPYRSASDPSATSIEYRGSPRPHLLRDSPRISAYDRLTMPSEVSRRDSILLDPPRPSVHTGTCSEATKDVDSETEDDDRLPLLFAACTPEHQRQESSRSRQTTATSPYAHSSDTTTRRQATDWMILHLEPNMCTPSCAPDMAETCRTGTLSGDDEPKQHSSGDETSAHARQWKVAGLQWNAKETQLKITRKGTIEARAIKPHESTLAASTARSASRPAHGRAKSAQDPRCSLSSSVMIEHLPELGYHQLISGRLERQTTRDTADRATSFDLESGQLMPFPAEQCNWSPWSSNGALHNMHEEEIDLISPTQSTSNSVNKLRRLWSLGRLKNVQQSTPASRRANSDASSLTLVSDLSGRSQPISLSKSWRPVASSSGSTLPTPPLAIPTRDEDDILAYYLSAATISPSAPGAARRSSEIPAPGSPYSISPTSATCHDMMELLHDSPSPMPRKKKSIAARLGHKLGQWTSPKQKNAVKSSLQYSATYAPLVMQPAPPRVAVKPLRACQSDSNLFFRSQDERIRRSPTFKPIPDGHCPETEDAASFVSWTAGVRIAQVAECHTSDTTSRNSLAGDDIPLARLTQAYRAASSRMQTRATCTDQQQSRTIDLSRAGADQSCNMRSGDRLEVMQPRLAQGRSRRVLAREDDVPLAMVAQCRNHLLAWKHQGV